MRLRSRLLLLLSLGLLLGGLALAFGAASVLRGTVREVAMRRLEMETSLLAQPASVAQHSELSALAADWGRALGLRVTLMDAEGRVLADTAVQGALLNRLESHADREEVVAARNSGWGSARRRSATTSEEYFYCARRVEGAGLVRTLRLAMPLAEIESFEADRLVVIVLLFVGLLTLVGAVTWVLVRRFTRPIEIMAAVAEQVALGASNLTVPEPEEEELARLGGSINRMQSNLLARVADKAAEEALLRAMMDGVGEGLLLIGPDERIVRANRAYCELFAAGVEPVGRRLPEVVRQREVLQQIARVLNSHEETRFILRGVDETEHSYEVLLRPIVLSGSDHPGVLALFFDISRLEALENMRRRFVADVSHELRTPITAIKGAVEMLLDSSAASDPATKKFLQMAERQAERMTALVADLTDLSLMETGAVKLELRSVDLGEVVREVLHVVEHKLQASGVRASAAIPAGLQVRADRRRLEQVLQNLVDNAIKFNREGGSVTVRATPEKDAVVLEVQDTGIGIPEASGEMVFQRFFRMDRARDRAVGGTGLGLAIVKHLVLLHGGSISVRSQQGVGSTFVIRWPL